jgi:excinuclease ABC subunit A
MPPPPSSRSEAAVARPLQVLREVGLGYLRLGQPATELSGGEAQRIKLATELQRAGAAAPCTCWTSRPPACTRRRRPPAGPADRLVDAGNTVIVVEHTMRVVAACDWVIDIGPGAGEEGGTVVAAGAAGKVAAAAKSRTAPYLRPYLRPELRAKSARVNRTRGILQLRYT